MRKTILVIGLLLLMAGYFIIVDGWGEFWKGEKIKFQIANFQFQMGKNEAGKNMDKLVEDINRLIRNKQGIYGVYVIDLVGGKSFGINEAEKYLAASVMKVALVAVLYSEADKGNINLKQIITIQADDIQDYGTGVIRYQEPGRRYSLQELASLSIIESDNTAAHIIGQIIHSQVLAYLEKWALKQTDVVDNTTTAKEMGQFFASLFYGRILNEQMTQKLLFDLRRVKHNSRIPKLLPQDVIVAHKEGTWTNNLSDVGIVYSKNPYVIALFTKGINEAEANEVLPQISRAVYEEMK